jgi:hypothetical protein
MYSSIRFLNLLSRLKLTISRRKMLIGLPMSSEHETNAEEWMKDPLHYLHCLDYMAQVRFQHQCLWL